MNKQVQLTGWIKFLDDKFTQIIEEREIRLNAHAEDITEQAHRIEELQGRLGTDTLDLAAADLYLAHRIEGLVKRIEQLERLLEKGQKKEG